MREGPRKAVCLNEANFPKDLGIADKYESLEISMETEKVWKDGGGKGIRTLDPSVANAVLSQLSYAPMESPSN